MTAEPTIPAAIIEKAAKASFENYCNEPWKDVDPETQANWCSDTDAALSAVYADIKAEAIRDVHAAIQAVLDSDSLMAQLLRMDCNSTARDAVGWTQSTLSACADELDGGLPVPAWTVPFTKIPGGSATWPASRLPPSPWPH